jgi:hypothetical protein
MVKSSEDNENAILHKRLGKPLTCSDWSVFALHPSVTKNTPAHLWFIHLQSNSGHPINTMKKMFLVE